MIGEEGDENFDYGYGSATYLSTDEVHELADKLSKVNLGKLKAEFSLSMFLDKDIYVFSDPDSVEDEDEEKDYIFENFENLIHYFKEASTNNQLIIKMLM